MAYDPNGVLPRGTNPRMDAFLDWIKGQEAKDFNASPKANTSPNVNWRGTPNGGATVLQGSKYKDALNMGQQVVNNLRNTVPVDPGAIGTMRAAAGTIPKALGVAGAGSQLYSGAQQMMNGNYLEGGNNMLAGAGYFAGPVGKAYSVGNSIGGLINTGIDAIGGEKGALGGWIYDKLHGEDEFTSPAKPTTPKPEQSEYRSSLTGPARYDVNSPEFDLVRNHFASAGNLPYEPNVTKSEEVAPALPQMNPAYLQAAKADYDTRVAALDPRIADTQNLRDRMYNITDSSQFRSLPEGGYAAAEMARIGLQKGDEYNSHLNDFAKTKAGIDPNSFAATKEAYKNRESAELKNWEEGLPSKKSAIEAQKAMANYHNKQADATLSKDESKKAAMDASILQHLIDANKNSPNPVSLGELMREYEMAKQGKEKIVTEKVPAVTRIFRPDTPEQPRRVEYRNVAGGGAGNVDRNAAMAEAKRRGLI